MKKGIIVLLAMLMIFAVGCNKTDSDKKEEIKVSKEISSMEVQLGNSVIKLTDKLTYSDLEKSGLTITADYESTLDKKLKVSKNSDSIISESYNVQDKSGNLVAVSVVNLDKKQKKVRECTIYFISAYEADGYNHSYILPSEVKYNDSADSIEKKIGKATLDLRNMEMGKMLQYIFDEGTFTANLNSKNQMTAFSYMLSDKILFDK